MKRCRWVKPSMVCEVKFTEGTRDDRLRQPVFLGIREDKDPAEGVRAWGSQAARSCRRDLHSKLFAKRANYKYFAMYSVWLPTHLLFPRLSIAEICVRW